MIALEIARRTPAKARAGDQADRPGSPQVGAPADVAVLRLHRGTFGFVDVRGAHKIGTQKLENELTVRQGRIVWDLNGIASVNWQDLPAGRIR